MRFLTSVYILPVVFLALRRQSEATFKLKPSKGFLKVKGKQGFTLLELLIVLGILGIILGISVLSGQRVLRGQEERAALHSFRQAVTSAATAANSRNAFMTIFMRDDKLVVRDVSNGRELRTYPVPESVQTGLPVGSPFLEFGPNGKVTAQYANASRLNFTFQTSTKTYDLEVSLIGEVRVK